MLLSKSDTDVLKKMLNHDGPAVTLAGRSLLVCHLDVDGMELNRVLLVSWNSKEQEEIYRVQGRHPLASRRARDRDHPAGTVHERALTGRSFPAGSMSVRIDVAFRRWIDSRRACVSPFGVGARECVSNFLRFDPG